MSVVKRFSRSLREDFSGQLSAAWSIAICTYAVVLALTASGAFDRILLLDRLPFDLGQKGGVGLDFRHQMFKGAQTLRAVLVISLHLVEDRLTT